MSRKPSFLVGIAFGGLIGMGVISTVHRHDWENGYQDGRMTEQTALALRQAQLNQDLRQNGLCRYADMACGFYHNPNPVRSKRP